MRWFGRRRYTGVRGLDADAPDATFPFLSLDQAATVRALVRTAFAERGVEVVAGADHVQGSDGSQYGLANVMAMCQALARRDWPTAVEQHVTTVLEVAHSPSPDELDEQELLRRVFVRVMGTSSLPDLDGFGYRRDLGGDLVELLAVDYENHVAILRDEVVDRFDVDAFRHCGVSNLLAEPFGSYEEVKVDRHATFGCLIGESVYTASRLLTMDDVLRRTLGTVSAPDGVLVCVPNRHQLGFHVLGASSGLPLISGMAQFAAAGFEDGIGSVSPHLFWLRGARIEQLSFLDDEGIQIAVPEELAAALKRLTGE